MGTTSRLHRLGRDIVRARYIYLLLLLGMAYIAIFCYGPMYGLLMAFKKYNAGLGVWRSPWIGMKNFQRLLITPDFGRALGNTVIISCGRLLFEFPFPILLAIAINEVRLGKSKRIFQTVFTFPHFLSWVIVGSILITFMDNNGPVNAIIAATGHKKVNFLANTGLFRPLLYITSIWKSAGWSSIIYLAAISGINPELYEAAIIDGATRLQAIRHITLSGIRTVVAVLFILAVGNVMNGGFDQVFNLQNPVVRPVSDILDTYVYRITFQAVPDYGFSTAVGMFKSVINLALLLIANWVVRRFSGEGLWE